MIWKPIRRIYLYCSFSWVLVLFTLLLFEKVDHYIDISNELLKNPSFSSGPEPWSLSKHVEASTTGYIDLSNTRVTESHYINQPLTKPRSGYVRISADAMLVDVKVGPEVWQKARIDLLGREKGGKWRWDFPNTLFAETGSKASADISRVIHIPDEFSEIRVEAELTGGIGTFLVHRISLREVQPREGIQVLVGVLLVLWAVLGMFVLIRLMQHDLKVPVLIAGSIAFLLLLIPEGAKIVIQSLLSVDGLDMAVDHLILFFSATFIMLIYTGKRGIAIHLVLAGMITFSASTEILQYYSSHRDPGWMDALVNVAAILLATSIYTLSGFYTKPESFTH